jgi:hypothetical protein
MPKTCYMCTAKATSVEHVPPRCLFPEAKDLPPGLNFRKQLITVPSCDEHNGAKSKDDEYLLHSLLLNIPNNSTATNHTLTKLQRSIFHNPSIINALVSTQIPVVAEDTQSGQLHHTVAVQIDEKRLKTSLEMIGRALYFHHFNKRWEGAVSVYPHFLLWLTEPNAAELNKPSEEMSAAVEGLVQPEPRHGMNPDVFCYQIAHLNQAIELIMYLRIYEGSRVTLSFRRAN